MAKRIRPRGFDFYLKWSIGNWAENVVYGLCKEMLAREMGLQVYRYGYSAGAVPKNLAEFEKIQKEKKELEKFGKRPDLLLFDKRFAEEHHEDLLQLMKRPDEEVEDLVRKALLALEVEHSMWSVKQAIPRLSFTVKKEDVQPLNEWQQKYKVKIAVFQVFLDEVHFSFLDEITHKGKLRKDAKTKKFTYFFPISPQTRLADIVEVSLYAKVEFDEKGRLVPFIMLSGGKLINLNMDVVEKIMLSLKRV